MNLINKIKKNKTLIIGIFCLVISLSAFFITTGGVRELIAVLFTLIFLGGVLLVVKALFDF